ncbi:hypothetical protein ACHAWU_001908 [Discostella pseudostelligera]|uniref:DNA mismatch repair proteins mutS family domain-containing protein n=1 Tax=Discostella pseudostelligera TaxID=259834 RepID=A0ABD3MIQ3_9STRA
MNGGTPINPRSPRQVSHLLYGTIVGDGSNESVDTTTSNSNSNTNAINLGPTDKATLRRIAMVSSTYNNEESGANIIVHADSIDNGSTEKERERQSHAAALVLQCRELLSSLNDNDDDTSGSTALASTSSELDSLEYMEAGMERIGDTMSISSVSKSIDAMQANGGNSDEVGSTSSSSTAFNDDWDVEHKEEIESNATRQSALQSTMSPYERMVMDLFHNNIDSDDVSTKTIDPYWIEPLLSLTKSTSRSLVRQLSRSTFCPMGYDPSASTLSLFSSATKQQQIPDVGSSSSTASPTATLPSSTSLLSYVRTNKASHTDAILLIRVGDFYESYGIDAIMLVEHCGLNPMGGKARAGCPIMNVQATLDLLTKKGFRVAVYEEEQQQPLHKRKNNGNGGGGSKLKTRYLAQVVSSANPTYMHGLVLNSEDGDVSSSASSPGRSYVGVIETNAGYTLVEVSAEERTVMVSERLTSEAVACRLVAYPPADPLFYVPPYSNESFGSGKSRRLDRLPFLPWRHQQPTNFLASYGSQDGDGGDYGTVGKMRVKTLPPSLVVSPKPGLSDVERAKQTIVSAFLRLEDGYHRSEKLSVKEEANDDYLTSSSSVSVKNRNRRAVTHEDFAIVSTSSSSSSSSVCGHVDTDSSETTHSSIAVATTRPLHLETATQLGLMFDPALPSLISSLLPESAPSPSRRFLRRWLLIPPPPDVADAMSQLVRILKDENDKALPSLSAPPLTGKVISLIRAGQASAAVHCEILSSLDAACEICWLDGDIDGSTDNDSGIVMPLLKILHHDTGTKGSNATTMRKSFIDAMTMIASVVSTQSMDRVLKNIEYEDDVESDCISHIGAVVPPAFFERNEAVWRGRVKACALRHAHIVPTKAKRLAEAIAVDFWGVETITYDDDGVLQLSGAMESKSPVVQDIFNNLLAIKSVPSWIERAKVDHYFHPRDRNGKVLRTRYTTERVQEALSDYVEACSNAREEVESVLTQLSWDLVDGGHLSAIFLSSHLNLILATAAHHAASSNAKGWSVAKIHDGGDETSAGYFNCVWPYWMDRSESVSNTFDLNGLFLLTAPNMSGKSTLMRSTAAAALLTGCGLCAPVLPGSSVRRFDSLFVRGASADVPTEDKSAFGAEMGDVASLLRSCGSRSLVFVDEIGRGTSPKDGTSLAGAILEQMSESLMSGMFATHLHGILELPYSAAAESRLRKKRMAIAEDSQGQINWTYTLEDGVCTNSLALLTASKFGLPESIIKRASELSKFWDSNSSEQMESVVNMIDRSTVMNDIQYATTILEETVGKGRIIQIPPSYMSPPSLEGKSCVYILQIGGSNTSSMRYYVGETDSLARRLSDHRSKGKDWSALKAIAIEIDEGKSKARSIESLVIQKLAKSGFNMISIADGRSIRSWNDAPY